MRAYQISFSKSAEKELLRLPEKIGAKIFAKIELLAFDPRPAGCKKLAGSVNSYRLHIGDYRELYTIEEDMLLVEIVGIGDRKDVYK